MYGQNPIVGSAWGLMLEVSGHRRPAGAAGTQRGVLLEATQPQSSVLKRLVIFRFFHQFF